MQLNLSANLNLNCSLNLWGLSLKQTCVEVHGSPPKQKSETKLNNKRQWKIKQGLDGYLC